MKSNPKKNVIDRSSYEPAYVQLVRIVSQLIAAGTLLPGDQLPSEGQFCTQFNVSPMTVRRAVNILVERGLVSATQGKGTFVKPLDIGEADTVVLGYGLCSRGVVGIRATDCTLVVPRVDDCIAIFLGSCSAYRQQARSEPGTYCLTKGWTEVGDSPFAEYERMVMSRGPEFAERIVRLMLNNYKRLALINTGQYELERYRDYARRTAKRFGLRYEEIAGSTTLVKKMIHGPWDDEFVVVPPDQVIQFKDFFPTAP
jgi:hypothetical protein